MKLPSWSMTTASASDRKLSETSHQKGTAIITFNDRPSLRRWMTEHQWKKSWIFLEDAFFKELFRSNSNFALALKEKVVTIMIPKKHYVMPQEKLLEMDADYESSSWSFVVAGLRDIRRAVEAGVVIEIDGKKLKSFNDFYTWAHHRYHVLEEISDQWIGDDR